MGKLRVIFGGNIGFWVKNGDWGVKLQLLGKVGKIETFKNVRKHSKIFKNIQILSGNVQRYLKKFDNFFRIALCVSRIASEEFLATDFFDK